MSSVEIILGLQSILYEYLHDKDSTAILEENKLQIQYLLIRFFCLCSSNMAAITSSANQEYLHGERNDKLEPDGASNTQQMELTTHVNINLTTTDSHSNNSRLQL